METGLNSWKRSMIKLQIKCVSKKLLGPQPTKMFVTYFETRCPLHPDSGLVSHTARRLWYSWTVQTISVAPPQGPSFIKTVYPVALKQGLPGSKQWTTTSPGLQYPYRCCVSPLSTSWARVQNAHWRLKGLIGDSLWLARAWTKAVGPSREDVGGASVRDWSSVCVNTVGWT